MADPRAFVSFDFDNNSTERLLFIGQVKNSRTPFSIQDWSSKSVLPQAQWENLINEKVGKTNLMIVLVGESTSSASGVVKEIGFAHANNVPTFGVYVGGAGTSTTLPSGLPRNRVISWEWESIANAVKQMMGEGKNSP